MRLSSQISTTNAIKTPQAVVIRPGKITVNNQKAPTSCFAAVDIQPALNVLVIGSDQDDLTIMIVKKTAETLAEDGSEVTSLLPFSAPPSPYIANRVCTKEENYGLKTLINASSSFAAFDRN
ncbi:unnamed protein product [Nippostrongylus brasiliensis]|uniref:MSP domain-containing protein n=1 Tax=Nippostrongylus brasiliensis TaxID=27835 RepID=A0A0N4YM33_NIPBR|nr:hypothetical protein Q1695_003180 [Nippostrongylus brasiliensis]VDL81926.1 unnamed protein product [Nippostrongylus brasiliensis]